MPSAKDKIDAQVARNTIAAAKSVIGAQDAQIKSLQSRLANDARKKDRLLRPVHPSLALEIEYRRKLDKMIQEMAASVLYWTRAAFKANEPEVSVLDSMSKVEGRSAHQSRLSAVGNALDLPLAADALPANALRRAVRKLARRWQSRFNEASSELARWFGQRAHTRSTRTLQSILKRGGWSVDLHMTPAQRDILAASIHENVSLIRSIPSQYFTQIEGMVMRSVSTGRDLHQLTQDLQRQFRVTRRRAELIARDQNNKVNASLLRARQIELGISQAVWVHSWAGKHPRPTHVRNNGNRFDVREGWYDPSVRKFIHPGELISCRCVSRSVVPGLS